MSFDEIRLTGTHTALLAKARRVDISEFRVKNYAILRLRPRKPLFYNSWNFVLAISLPSLLLNKGKGEKRKKKRKENKEREKERKR